MNSKSYLLVGRGVETNHTTSSFKTNSNTNSISKIFKPIIATTLALSLGNAFVYSQEKAANKHFTGAGSDSNPLKVGNKTINESPNQSINIKFSRQNGPSTSGASHVGYDSSTHTVTYYNDSSKPNIVSNQQSHFQLDDSASMDSKFDYGTGTLAVYLDGALQIQPVIFTINADQDWVGNIKGILGSNIQKNISNGGVRKLRINLRKNFTGNINLVKNGYEPAGIGSDINLGITYTGNAYVGYTFKGNLDLSARGTTVNINGASYDNYKFEGQIILGGTEYASTDINATNVDFYLTKANNEIIFNPNTLITITGGTNTFNFKESVNIYGNIYTTGGTNTFTSNDSTKFYMAGDINAKGGTNAFVFKNNSITPVLAGNINVSGGSTSIVFDNTAWLSASYKQNYALKSTYGDKFLNIKNGEDKSDGINTFSTLTGNLNVTGGNANVAFRYNQEQLDAKPITYNVMVSNNGNANILLDTNPTNHSPFTFITNLMYAGVDSTGQWMGAGNNAINLIFAQGHNGNYGSNNNVSLNNASQTFLGATLTNGLRFEFKDKNIAKGSSNASFIATYKDAILSKVNQGGHKTDLLSVKFETGNSRINTITLTGVAVGNIYALNNQASAYNLVVDNNSVLFAQIDQSAANKLNMQLKEGSKLILDNSTSINKLETQVMI